MAAWKSNKRLQFLKYRNGHGIAADAHRNGCGEMTKQPWCSKTGVAETGHQEYGDCKEGRQFQIKATAVEIYMKMAASKAHKKSSNIQEGLPSNGCRNLATKSRS